MNCIYYPTTVIFVDDRKSFLTTLTRTMPKAMPLLMFNDPIKALDYINSTQIINNLSNVVQENVEDINYDLGSKQQNIKVNLSTLYNTIYSPDRFKEISILVVDYAMPRMEGSELCHLLKSKKFKKVMLTAHADEQEAVTLFNDGVIDKFLVKNDDELTTKLREIANDMQQKYFYEKSKVLMDSLKTSQEMDFLFNSQVFQNIFDEIVKRFNITEYYLLSTSGSYLLIDYQGNPCWLLVVFESELQDYITIAEDQKADLSIIQLLRHGLKIPYFATKGELFDAAGMKWEPYLYDAKKVTGKLTFYYSLIPDRNLFPINKERILSHEQYIIDSHQV